MCWEGEANSGHFSSPNQDRRGPIAATLGLSYVIFCGGEGVSAYLMERSWGMELTAPTVPNISSSQVAVGCQLGDSPTAMCNAYGEATTGPF